MKNIINSIRSLHDLKLFTMQLGKNLNQFDVDLSHSKLLHVVSNTLYNVNYHNVKKYFDEFPIKPNSEIFSHFFCYRKNRDYKLNGSELWRLTRNNLTKMQKSNQSLSEQFAVWHSYLIHHNWFMNPHFKFKNDVAYLKMKLNNKKLVIEISEIDYIDQSQSGENSYSYIRDNRNYKLSNNIHDLIVTIVSSKLVGKIICGCVTNKYLHEILKGYGFTYECNGTYNDALNYELVKSSMEC